MSAPHIMASATSPTSYEERLRKVGLQVVATPGRRWHRLTIASAGRRR